MKPLRIPAVYMRGGTSKGVFLREEVLPADRAERDRVLLRITGSPDAYGKQIDGMGAATSSTSKVVLVKRSTRPGFDVEYLFGQVAIDRATIDWSGNCGNLTTAVGPFAIAQGLVAAQAPVTTVRMWQANLGKPIVAHVPVADGEPVEDGDFAMDGVPFPGAEIRLEFIDAGGGDDSGAGGALLPTGNVVDSLDVPGVGHVAVTLVTAGNPTIFVAASTLDLRGTEMQAAVNGDRELLARLEAIRAHAAVAMGLAKSAEEATRVRPATPKISFVSPPQDYVASSGKPVAAADIDVTARILSMGALHHAYTGTGAVAIAVAAAIPGTVVASAMGGAKRGIRFGHVAGTLAAGAEVRRAADEWIVDKVTLSRSARRLMEGVVFVPAETARQP